MDVGGSSIRTASVTLDVQARPSVGQVSHTALLWGPDRPADTIELVLDRAAAAVANTQERVAALGVVLPGVVDDVRGVGVWSENLGWRDVPFAELLGERVSVPVSVGHDVRGWGLAEVRYGAARGFNDVAVVPLGTGISAALVVDGRTLSARGFAGEIGHLRVTGDQLCACGARGCLEAVASAAGIVRQYAAVSGVRVQGAAEVASAARRGEVAARQVWDTAIGLIADGLAALVQVVSPEAIVLGGGLAGAGEEMLFVPLRQGLEERLLYSPVPQLLPAAFQGTGGLIGAAVLASDRLNLA